MKISDQPISIFWFRRDLRLTDNAGLYRALKNSQAPVLPLFIFDTEILSQLEDKDDARVTFIHDTVHQLQLDLQRLGAALLVKYGAPEAVWSKLLATYNVAAVYTNHDYEPYARERDSIIKHKVEESGASFNTYKDHVLFEYDEVLKSDGAPYVVFTPYKRSWFEVLRGRPDHEFVSFYLKPYPTEAYFSNLLKADVGEMPTLGAMGFERSTLGIPPRAVKRKTIREYDAKRDYPAQDGTSRLGIHYRFGTISIREKALHAYHLNQTYLSELIWRDFYAQILAHFPHVVEGAFRPKYHRIQWRNDEHEFQAWCEGKTGYPLVDAGMRELNATGYMHNRVRMVVASFLTKHLLIDWRWGEAYFARRLLDFDLASNNGGWQWAAGCGTDAAPYFRIFNPESQMKKFDREQKYIRHWIAEFGTDAYPAPIVDHKFARERCLQTYKVALG